MGYRLEAARKMLSLQPVGQIKKRSNKGSWTFFLRGANFRRVPPPAIIGNSRAKQLAIVTQTFLIDGVAGLFNNLPFTIRVDDLGDHPDLQPTLRSFIGSLQVIRSRLQSTCPRTLPTCLQFGEFLFLAFRASRGAK